MQLKRNQIKTLAYSDLFNYPLSGKELKLWEISVGQKESGESKIKTGHRDGFYFLPGRAGLVNLRREREKYTAEKRVKGQDVARVLQRIPFVRAIFLTGSVAAGSAEENADIDLMIVVQPGALWLTRLSVVTYLKIKGIYSGRTGHNRNKICPNIFLDLNHLPIAERNLFTAHEVLQAQCLFDRGGIEKLWFKKNPWTREFLPNIFQLKVKGLKQIAKTRNAGRGDFLWYLILPLELLAFSLQLVYMKPKMTNENVGLGFAFFHPRNISAIILQQWQKRLELLK